MKKLKVKDILIAYSEKNPSYIKKLVSVTANNKEVKKINEIFLKDNKKVVEDFVVLINNLLLNKNIIAIKKNINLKGNDFIEIRVFDDYNHISENLEDGYLIYIKDNFKPDIFANELAFNYPLIVPIKFDNNFIKNKYFTDFINKRVLGFKYETTSYLNIYKRIIKLMIYYRNKEGFINKLLYRYKYNHDYTNYYYHLEQIGIKFYSLNNEIGDLKNGKFLLSDGFTFALNEEKSGIFFINKFIQNNLSFDLMKKSFINEEDLKKIITLYYISINEISNDNNTNDIKDYSISYLSYLKKENIYIYFHIINDLLKECKGILDKEIQEGVSYYLSTIDENNYVDLRKFGYLYAIFLKNNYKGFNNNSYEIGEGAVFKIYQNVEENNNSFSIDAKDVFLIFEGDKINYFKYVDVYDWFNMISFYINVKFSSNGFYNKVIFSNPDSIEKSIYIDELVNIYRKFKKKINPKDDQTHLFNFNLNKNLLVEELEIGFRNAKTKHKINLSNLTKDKNAQSKKYFRKKI